MEDQEVKHIKHQGNCDEYKGISLLPSVSEHRITSSKSGSLRSFWILLFLFGVLHAFSATVTSFGTVFPPGLNEQVYAQYQNAQEQAYHKITPILFLRSVRRGQKGSKFFHPFPVHPKIGISQPCSGAESQEGSLFIVEKLQIVNEPEKEGLTLEPQIILF